LLLQTFDQITSGTRYSRLTVVIFFESSLMQRLIIIKGENNEKNS